MSKFSYCIALLVSAAAVPEAGKLPQPTPTTADARALSPSKPTNLYLHADGTLSFTAPAAAEAGGHRDYVSDPANPVPYRERPISPTYPGGDWRRWECADQRFVDHRPDVLSFVSAPLTSDVTIAGEVSATLFASTSGTDSDFVVKLIDVFPRMLSSPNGRQRTGPNRVNMRRA